MKNIDIFVLSVVLIIFVFYFCFKKTNKININKNIREDFNSLYNYSKMNLTEDHGIGMFGGNDEVHVYKIDVAPIAGMAGAQQTKNTQNHPMPAIGFKPSEVKKINNFEGAVKSKNEIEYVDNSLMVPLLYHVTKRLTVMFKSLQDQISECCY